MSATTDNQIESQTVDSTDDLLDRAREAGWSHSYDRTPFENLRSLLEATEHIDATRPQYAAAAFKSIMGFGPSTVENAFEKIAAEGEIKIPDDVDNTTDDQGADDVAADTDSDTTGEAGEELTAEAIREHYRRAHSVYEELADIDSGGRTVGKRGHNKLYETQQITDPELIEDGFNRKARGKPLLSTAEDMAADGSKRAIYGLLTYSTEYDNQWVPYRFEDDDRQWRGGENPMVDYNQIDGQMIFHDVDIKDEHKERPLPDSTREIVEAALDRHIQNCIELAGDVEHVYLLDSVGGAYPIIPPTATTPITEEFAPEDADQILDELTGRVNDWLSSAWDDVVDEINGVDEYLDPDEVNHKSRPYKAPLSIHASIDSVVTPIDPTDITYRHVPVADVDEQLIERCEQWASEVTDDRHRNAVDSIIQNLWPDHYDDAGDWITALNSWLFDQARQNEKTRRRNELKSAANESGEDAGSGELNADQLRFVRSMQQVEEDLDDLDIEEVISETILGAGWTDRLSDCTDNSGSDKRAFVPSWASGYESGNATFAITAGSKEGVWVDTSNDYKGGPVEAALIARATRSPGAGWASGEQWARGVEELAQMGFDVGYYLPDATTEGVDQMPLWAIKKLGELLDITGRADLVEREGEGGDTYLSLRQDAYKRVIQRAEAIGFDTGRRDHLDADGSESPYFDIDLGKHASEDAAPYADPEAMLAACLRARDADAVAADAEPPTMALIPIVSEVTGREATGDMAPGTRSIATEIFQEDLSIEDVDSDASGDRVTIGAT